MPRYGLFLEDSSNSETPLQYRDFRTKESFSDDYCSSDDQNELNYTSSSSSSSSRSDDGDEPDFSSLGHTRYSLDPTSESMAHYRRRWGYQDDDAVVLRIVRSDNSKFQGQKYPSLSNYLDASVAPTCALLRALKTSQPAEDYEKVDDNDIDRLAGLLQAAAVIEDIPRRQTLLLAHQQAALQQDQNANLRIQQEMRTERLRIEKDKQEAAQGLRLLLQRAEKEADKIRAALRQQEEEIRKQEELEQQKAEDEQRAKLRAQEKEQAEAEAKAQAEAEARRKAEAVPDYVAKANKLRSQLVQVQASVEPFDKSKVVAKRRLGYKKIVNGKVNTLAENVDKIRSVAADVAATIAQARTEDEQNKNTANAPPEAARGKRYLVNLLCSKVIVRAQAEGFNGQRGDGFPLANMLALVSAEAKDIVPVLAAHIYTVCPTAVPQLPHPAPDASEDEVMESLGMLKLKDGQYETFERFLARTEGVISLVADIVASEPEGHSLLGGQKGGIDWLSRFLDLLPPAPQSPLPLLTSPVLDAFLTGAGHMLARKFPDEFKKCLDTISNDVINRVDESAIGMPSATRLKKTIKGGFEKFKTTLPSRALPELYCPANSASSAGQPPAATSFSSPFASNSVPSQTFPSGQSQGKPPCKFFAQGQCKKGANCPFSHDIPQGANAAPASAPSPFGNSAVTGSSPFASSTAPSSPFAASTASTINSPFTSSTAPNPFAASGPAPSPSPFGTAPSPFGSNAPASASANNPFGGGSFGQQPLQTSTAPLLGPLVPAPSPFGSSAAAPAPSPFGSTAPATSPFGGGFGQQTSIAPAFGSAPVAQSPFGSASAAPSPSPFGSSTPISAPSPFSSFGQQQTAPPFGSPTAAPPPFGTAPAPAFGGFGAASPFGTPAPATGTPFGSSPAPVATPFSAPAPSAFGSSVATPLPFGTAAPSSSPFGSPQPFGQQASPFGAPSTSSTSNQFGGGFGSQQTSGKQPCKFFAQGKCTYGNNCRFSHDTPQAAFSSPSPFGSPQPFGQQASSFGASASIPIQTNGFGSQQNTGKQPCKFFAEGKCTFGNNCRFSHETPQAGPFGISNPFGAPRR